MDTFLRPGHFDPIPNARGSDKGWQHCFTNFLTSITEYEPNSLNVLINYVSPEDFEYIADCTDYESALETLESLYITPKNEIFAQHLLATRRQQAGESLDEFLLLSKDCNFKAVSAENYQKEMIRDAFIKGLLSQHIRQRLIENTTLDLDAAYKQAGSLESAQRNLDVYSTQGTYSLNTVASPPDVDTPAVNAVNKSRKCYFCGNNIHNRQNCPAHDFTRNKSGKTGHFAKVCHSKSKSSQAASASPVADTPPSASSSASVYYPTLATISAASQQGLQKSVVKLEVNEHSFEALIDRGSTDSFMSQKLASKLQLSVSPVTSVVTMTDSSLQAKGVGYSVVNLKIADNYFYENVKLSILEKLCSEVLIGLYILQQHKSFRRIKTNFVHLCPVQAINSTTITLCKSYARH